jgi:hypothetical protein
MTTTTRFDEIAQRSRRSRVRDAAFALFLAAMATLSVTSVRAATLTASAAPSQTVQAAGMTAAGSVCDVVIC